MEIDLPALSQLDPEFRDVPWQAAQPRERAEAAVAQWDPLAASLVVRRRCERAVLIRRNAWTKQAVNFLRSRSKAHPLLTVFVYMGIVGLLAALLLSHVLWPAFVTARSNIRRVPEFLRRQMRLGSSDASHEHAHHVSWTITDSERSVLFVVHHDHPRDNQSFHRSRVEKWKHGVLTWILWTKHMASTDDVDHMDATIYLADVASVVCVRSPQMRLRVNKTLSPHASLVLNWDRAVATGFVRSSRLRIHETTVPDDYARALWDPPPLCHRDFPHCIDSPLAAPDLHLHRGALNLFLTQTRLADALRVIQAQRGAEPSLLLDKLVNCSASVNGHLEVRCPGDSALPRQNGTWLSHLPSPWDDGIERTVWSDDCETFPREWRHVCSRFQACVQASTRALIPPCLMHTTPFPGAPTRVIRRAPCRCVGEAWHQLNLPENRIRQFENADAAAHGIFRYLLLLYQPCVWQGLASFRQLGMLCTEPASGGTALVSCSVELSVLTQEGVNAWTLVSNRTTARA